MPAISPRIGPKTLFAATFGVGFMLAQHAVAATTPVVIDALASAPILTIGPAPATIMQPPSTAASATGGLSQPANPDSQGSAVAIRYFNLDGGFSNTSSAASDQSHRDGSHGQSHEHHFEKEGGTSVSSVPLPTGFWLFGSGLIAFLVASKHKKSTPWL